MHVFQLTRRASAVFRAPVDLAKTGARVVVFLNAFHAWVWLRGAAQLCVLFPKAEKEQFFLVIHPVELW